MFDSGYPFDLGSYTRRITTTSAEAQTWFDRGLIWCYAFNHEEGAICFEKAIEIDPRCAMAYWGVAYAIGPNYNKTWSRYDTKDLENTICKGQLYLDRAKAAVSANTSPAEKGLIEALCAKFPAGQTVESLDALDSAYANAMTKLFSSCKCDLDISALHAEALMCLRPRKLWNIDTGAPTTKDTVLAQEAIESGFRLPGGLSHPALNHLYIHLMEMSTLAGNALPAANRLRGLVPDGSHLQHMATHIDLVVGDYRQAMSSNHKAMLSDDVYFAQRAGGALYSAYRAHNIHALTYAAMCAGQYGTAVSAAQRLSSLITPEVLAIQSPPMVDWVEFHGGVLVHVYVRFGRWQNILELEFPDDRKTQSITTAILHYGRSLALGVLERCEEAWIEFSAFETACQAIPSERCWGVTSTAKEVLAVASHMCCGELKYREGAFDEAYTLLREAVVLEDSLPFTEPPLWMQPVRHALGALLFEQGRIEEAEEIYRQDLGLSERISKRRARLNNIWSLHGLCECLARRGSRMDAPALELQRDIAMASCDVDITASCFCAKPAGPGPRSSDCCT